MCHSKLCDHNRENPTVHFWNMGPPVLAGFGRSEMFEDVLTPTQPESGICEDCVHYGPFKDPGNIKGICKNESPVMNILDPKTGCDNFKSWPPIEVKEGEIL